MRRGLLILPLVLLAAPFPAPAKPGEDEPWTVERVEDLPGLPADIASLAIRAPSGAADAAPLTNADLRHLGRLTGLRSLDLSRAGPQAGPAGVSGSRWDLHLTDAGLAHIAAVKTLWTLSLPHCARITDAGLARLADSLPELSLLFLPYWGAFGDRNDAKLECLERFGSLKILLLDGCGGEHASEWPARIARIPGLDLLSVRRCPWIRGGGLAPLAKAPHLSSLVAGPLDDGDLAPIRSFSSLESLILENCPDLTGAGLVSVAGVRTLESLFLSDCPRLDTLAPLEGLPSLAHLSLVGCPALADEDLAVLAGREDLESLVLTGCTGITDAGLAHLAGPKGLTHLDLGALRVEDSTEYHPPCRVTDAGLAHLAGLARLEHLDLSGIRFTFQGCRTREQGPLVVDEPGRVTDEGLETISRLRSLRRLCLCHCPGITDEGVAILAKMTWLTRLDLIGSENISPKGERALREALPDCVIRR
jgi:hypothetical protein